MARSALLLEHHGKQLLRAYGIATPRGALAHDKNSLEAASGNLPERVVLKAQIAAGGRGKSGGIHFAEGKTDLARAFDSLKARTIMGLAVDVVLVEEHVSFERERYAGIMIDGDSLVLLFGRVGGIDIEVTTANDPSNLQLVRVDPVSGPSLTRLEECFERLGYPADRFAAYQDLAARLVALCRGCDATMVEINPLAELSGGELLALDARIYVDEAAIGRQLAVARMLASSGSDNVAGTVAAHGFRGLSYKRHPDGGVIGLIGLGAGLNLALMDWIASLGSRVANLVDIDDAIGAGCAEQGFSMALDEFDTDPSIRAILVNIITCGYRLDDIAASLLRALAARSSLQTKPITLHLRGNAMELAPGMLVAAGWRNSPSIRDAISEVVIRAGS